MGKIWALVMLFFIILVLGIVLILLPGPHTAQAPTTTNTPASLDDLIRVSSPLPDMGVSSPLTITGEARGGWFFEGSAPVELRDANGVVIASGPVQAQGDWMTANYVPFSVTLTFAPPKTQTGTLVLKNDNPSGKPENQKELNIPVKFK